MVHALRFIEIMSGVPEVDQLSRHPLVSAQLQEHAAVRPSAELKPNRKAPPTTIVMVVAMECKVVDALPPNFIKVCSWYRLVRIWTAMRFDDHRGLVPGRLKLLALGLRGTLVRTKTSGGKQAQTTSRGCGGQGGVPSSFKLA